MASDAYYSHLLKKLSEIVASNELQRFYPSQADVERIAARICKTVDLERVRQSWNLPWTMVVDICSLALYDTVIYADDSGSMNNETRIDDLRMILGRVSEAATLFDSDGISVRFMNSDMAGDGITTAVDAAKLLENIYFNGGTPLATEMDSKILQPMVLKKAKKGTLQKPVLVITITDGEPNPEPKSLIIDTIRRTKSELAKTPYKSKAVAFQFAQVGRDLVAQAFLATLDQHHEIGSQIDCTSYFEMEQEEFMKKEGQNLTIEMWLVKLMVGAVDPSYDSQDE